MKKVMTIAALVVALTLALTCVAFAAQTAPTAPGTKKNAAARLEKAKKRIANMVERADKMKARALKRVKKADARFQKAVDKLKSQGKDVSKLLADREVLASKVKVAEQDFDAIVAKLKEAEGLAAESTLEQFRAALQEAKELRGRVRTDLQEIRNYAKTVIIPLIKELNGGQKPRQNSGQNQNVTPNTQAVPITL
jgi:chromosome segregation ATPase